MNSFGVYDVNLLKAFDSKFSEYLSHLKDYIGKSDLENQDFNKMYLESIEASFRNKKINCEQYNQLEVILNDSNFLKYRKDKINTISKIFIRKIEFENSTLDDRDIEKTLDITNEIYSSLSKNIIKVNKNYKKTWVSSITFPEMNFNSYYSQIHEKKEKKHANRNYQHNFKECSN